MSRVFVIEGLRSFEALEQKLSLSAVTGGLSPIGHHGGDDLPPPDPEPDPGPMPGAHSPTVYPVSSGTAQI
jgi:hypothetical protein